MDIFINADEIARGLSPLNPAAVAIEAGKLMLARLDKLIQQRADFVFETTGAGVGHVGTLKRCREAGYTVHILYFYLSSVELAIDRVAQRVRQGGHFVPEQDIIRRYHLGLTRLFSHYVPLADSTTLILNDSRPMQLIAKKSGLDSWTIHHPTIWNLIQEKLHEI